MNQSGEEGEGNKVKRLFSSATSRMASLRQGNVLPLNFTVLYEWPRLSPPSRPFCMFIISKKVKVTEADSMRKFKINPSWLQLPPLEGPSHDLGRRGDVLLIRWIFPGVPAISATILNAETCLPLFPLKITYFTLSLRNTGTQMQEAASHPRNLVLLSCMGRCCRGRAH